MVEVEKFFKRHKERILIDIIGEQKQEVILDMPWLACHNLEIDQRIGEVQMTRCLDKCGKKQKMERQTKPKQQKQKKKEKKKEEYRRLTTEEEIVTARIVKEKEEERDKKEDLIELRTVEEIVPRQFHKYLKVFEKKELERMPTKKTWNYAIDLREEFVLKKGKIYLLLRAEREEVQEFVRDQLRKRYIRLSKSLQTLPVFFVPKKDGKKRMV